MVRPVRLTVIALTCLISSITFARQVVSPAVAAGSITEAKVTANELKGNLLGDPSDMRVAVYVPPSYASSPERRYPTLYLLVEQYRSNLEKLRGIHHTFEAYTDGTHEGRIRNRIETRVLRFFSAVLTFAAS